MGLSYSQLHPGPGTGLPASTRSLINLGKVKEDRMVDSIRTLGPWSLTASITDCWPPSFWTQGAREVSSTHIFQVQK